MVKCHIKNCDGLKDPIKSPEIMSDLSDTRRASIMKYKMVADRKRSLAAGLLIRDFLLEYDRSWKDIDISDKGRPMIEGIDFNVSHSGSYAIIAISEKKIGCDIEHIKGRDYHVAKRYFSETETAWMEEAESKDEAFYRIWTARESYSKSTGEGILLEFDRYEIRPDSGRTEPEDVLDKEADYLGSCEVIRDGKLQECIIFQWLYDKEYIISICVF